MSTWSDRTHGPSVLYVLKVYGQANRLRRTTEGVRRLIANPSDAICVCQEDQITEKLRSLGFESLSYTNALNNLTELKAWRDAIRVKREIAKRLARKPLLIGGYDCTSSIIGDPDRFAFLGSILLLRDLLGKRGFRIVIFIPSVGYLNQLPNVNTKRYAVWVDRDVAATFRNLWMLVAPYVLPILAATAVSLFFPLFSTYTKSPTHGTGSHSKPRVLIVAADRPAFPSFYSRPAAAIAEACAEKGYEVRILTNMFASAEVFFAARFEQTCRRVNLGRHISNVWRFILQTRRARAPRRGSAIELNELALALVKQEVITSAVRVVGEMLILGEAFARYTPNVLVAIPDSGQLGMSAIVVARHNRVPSLTALAGQIFDHPQYGNLNADYVAVNGIAAKAVFLKRRISKRRVFVTGMAHLNHTFKLADSAKPISMTNSKLVLFATENLPFAETLQMIKPVADFVLRTSNTQMVVRPHPRENPNTYLDFIRGLNSNSVVLDTKTPLLDLLSTADVCVTGFSNVAVEAMIMNKPVVCMNLTKRPDILGYVTDRAALGVHNPDETATTLRLALYDESTKTILARGRAGFLRRRFYRADGKASERIASLIGRLANRHG